MNLPPLLMRLRVFNKRSRISLWIPLFLIWPIVLAIAIVLAPLVLIIALITWPIGWGKPFLLAGPTIGRCVCALHGLEVDVKEGDQSFLISFK
jgi:hypothetical protein